MEFNELKTLIKENEQYGCCFIVKYNNGETKKQRLFVSSNDVICEFLPRSRTKGRAIAINNINSIKPIHDNISEIACCRNNLRLVIEYLTASGMWKNKLKGAHYLQSLSDHELLSMRDWDTYHRFMDLAKNGAEWFGMDCFDNLFTKKIKTTRFDKYDRLPYRVRIRESIFNNQNYQHSWTNGYDNSVEIKHTNDGDIKGFYSEEYRGCGNGHYYFMLDECHVLFGEDD
jgi:hypothetical protein